MIRRTLIASSIALILVGTSSVLAEKQTQSTLPPMDIKPFIEKAPTGIFIDAPIVNNLTVMIVQVVNDQGEQVLNIRSKGTPVELLANGLPDGEYFYRVKTIYQLDTPVNTGPGGTTEGSLRDAGSFYINNSEIIQPESQDNIQLDDDLSLLETITTSTLAILGSAVNTLVPEVLSADIDSSTNGVFRMEDDEPYFIVYHNNNTTSSSGRQEWWRMWFYDQDSGGTDTPGFEIYDSINGNTVIDIAAGTGNHNAVQYLGNGNIRWANGSMEFSKSLQRLTIGAATGAATLNLYDDRPSINLVNQSDDHAMWLDVINGKVNLLTTTSRASNIYSNPITIATTAPNNSLDILSDGYITTAHGMSVGTTVNTSGTIFKIGNSGSDRAQMEFEDDTGSMFLEWGQQPNKLQIENDAGTPVIDFDLSAPAYSLALDSSGNLGLGVGDPGANLHIRSNAGTTKALVEETNSTRGARTLFEIKNNGNPEFRMTNSGNGNSWLFSAGLRFVVKNNAGDWVSRVDANGNMEITGALTTAGGTCGGGGCDLLFHPDTKIESIEEHAAAMWANSYLPAVGPTVENEPFNLSEKTGGMLNELEKAHVYIEQLNKALIAQNQQLNHKLVDQNQQIAALRTEQAELKNAVMLLIRQKDNSILLTGN